MNDATTRPASPLDDPPAEFEGRPFFGETVTLLSSVRGSSVPLLGHRLRRAGRNGLRIMSLRTTCISSILAR